MQFETNFDRLTRLNDPFVTYQEAIQFEIFLSRVIAGDLYVFTWIQGLCQKYKIIGIEKQEIFINIRFQRIYTSEKYLFLSSRFTSQITRGTQREVLLIEIIIAQYPFWYIRNATEF